MVFVKKHSRPICILAGAFLFWLAAFFLFGQVGMPERMDSFRDSALYACLYLACLLAFARCHSGMRPALLCFCAFCIGGALLLRFCLIPHISRDMSKFLLPWVEAMAAAPGTQGLSLDIGNNYYVPYMTLLWAISRLPGSPVFYIKLVSIAFDLLAAFTMERLAGYFCNNEKQRMLPAFFLTLFLPTLLLNSACWGQCDSIYAALGLGALYYGLLGNSRLCWCFLGLSFAVKIQAVFLFPLILVLVILKKISGKDSLFFFLSYLLAIVPALLAGRSLWDTLLIYARQTTEKTNLVRGQLPNFYILFWGGTTPKASDMASWFGILAAGLVVMMALACAIRFCRNVSNNALLLLSLLLIISIPYFLPHMHERYYLLAELLFILYALRHPERWHYAAAFLFASYNSYALYLWSFSVLDVPVAALLVTALLALLARELWQELAG